MSKTQKSLFLKCETIKLKNSNNNNY